MLKFKVTFILGALLSSTSSVLLLIWSELTADCHCTKFIVIVIVYYRYYDLDRHGSKLQYDTLGETYSTIAKWLFLCSFYYRVSSQGQGFLLPCSLRVMK